MEDEVSITSRVMSEGEKREVNSCVREILGGKGWMCSFADIIFWSLFHSA